MRIFFRYDAVLVAALMMLGASGPARAQADAPPEREGKPTPAPSKLPPVDAPKPEPKGKLALTFAGAKAFPDKDLQDALKRQIADIEESGLDDASAYDAAFFLDTFYRKHGYSDVDVKSEIKGPWSLTLVVNEGPVTKIAAFHIRGSKAYDDKTLINYLLGPTRERFSDIKVETELPFVEADVNSGTDLVKRLYASEGYLDAVLDPIGIQLSRDKQTAVVTLVIHEGRQYHFGKISIKGNRVFTDAQLRAEMVEDTDKPFTVGRLTAAQRKLEDYYKKRGYFTVKVEEAGAKEAAVNGRVPVTFSVTEGALYHFDGITTEGLRDVKSSFLEQRFKKLKGKAYDPDLIDKEFREMIQTGLFKSLRITPKAVDGDLIQLDLVAEEAKPKAVGFSLGYSSFEGGIAGVSYTDRNLFGSGRPLTFSTEINGLGYKGELLYSDPWFLDSDYSLKLRAYAMTEDLEGYSKFEYGFQPTLSRKITDHWELSAFILTKRLQITDVEIRPVTLVGATDYGITSAGITQTIDYRDNKAAPMKGFILVTTVDGSLNGFGSDVSFLRATARFTWYVPITAKTSLAIGARGGVISAQGGPEALPIDERFFNGGANSVRSFRERELGPRDLLGFPIGGDAYTTFNIEYTFPIAGDLKGAVFGDAGSVTTSLQQYGPTELRFAVGAGLRYNLPFGPVRLDLGLNPSRKEGEDRGAILFSIGVAF